MKAGAGTRLGAPTYSVGRAQVEPRRACLMMGEARVMALGREALVTCLREVQPCAWGVRTVCH